MDAVEVPVKKMESLTSSKNSSLKSAKTSVNTPNSRTPGSVSSVRNKSEVPKLKLSLTKTPPCATTPASVPRRKSTGGLSDKRGVVAPKKQDNGVSSDGKQKASFPSISDPGKRSGTERRASLPTISRKAPVPRLSARSLSGKSDSTPKPPVRSPATSTGSVTSSVKGVPSSSLDTSSNGRSGIRRAPALSSPRTPMMSSRSFRSGSLSASVDRGSSISGRRKTSTPDSREARFMMLPQVDIKAGDDVRLDLRGRRLRSLGATGLNLSPNLEFVYLRDNLLSSVEGIEILKRVKVLDLSFNDFKVPGFEPLGNCKALQQLYLAGNQITSLASLPQLPNLEFLSVAQNRLKSLSMASQPRLQVLAASKNKISTLKEFPHLPVLEMM